MKNFKIAFTSIAIIVLSISSKAQLSGSGAYMKGNYIEIGISGIGGFEGADCATAPVPSGMHLRSANNLFGFVANPQMDGWINYDGDFFTPGSPENGWGFEVGTSGSALVGDLLGNNCSYLQQINGAITSWTYAGGQTLCDWEGDATSGVDLHFKINYDLHDNDLFYITTISITNNTGATIPELYYYRNLDPDHNQELGGGFTTQQTIVSQISMGGPHTSVSATQTTPWNSFFEFLAIDPDWVAGFGGFANRDASDLWSGGATGTGTFTHTVGAMNIADEGINLVHKIINLAPGNTEVFKFASIFDPGAVTAAVTALSLSTYVQDMNVVQDLVTIYPNPLNENATINIDNSVVLKNASMRVYDILGKEVIAISDIQSHQFVFEKRDLITGIYFYKIINNEQQIASGKMLIK